MPNWNYTHGSTTDRNRLRFLLGDHRGTSGAWTGTNQVFSDEELDDLLTLTSNNIMASARIAMQNRVNREAMNAGVAGTTDTTDRPSQLVQAVRQLERLSYPDDDTLPQVEIRTNEDLDDLTDMGDTA